MMTRMAYTMTSLISPQAWDVWLAYVRFADHPEIGKVRPVVILENNIVAVIAAKVTTAGNDEKFPFCELKDWAVEGLRKPSRVQVAPLLEIQMQEILREAPLGRLTDVDKIALQNALETQ